MTNNDIQLSIDAFRLSAQRYERPERYYNGQHDLRFATEKFENAFGSLFREFALNLCPIVCDAIKDKLRVTGFSKSASLRVSVPPAVAGGLTYLRTIPQHTPIANDVKVQPPATAGG